jgi:hypothetical protein
MSPTAVAEEQDLDLGPRESYEFYLPIVREYADKLSSLCQRAFEIAPLVNNPTQVEFATLEATRLIDQYECLKPLVEQLVSRTVSLLDHARVGRALELHMALRYEELEAALRLAPAVFAKLESVFGSKKIRPIIDRSRVTPLRS